MTSNVGGIDRILRIVLGIAILSLLFLLDGNARWWGLLGVVPLATGLLRNCPLYSMLGISSCPLKGPRN